MMKQAVKMAALAILIVMLAGCGGATPTVEAPTPDQAATLAILSTQAAQTVVANLTQNAPTVTNTVPPTETQAPTNTPEPTATTAPVVLPTNTLALPTATLRPAATLGPTFTPTVEAAFACQVTSASPAAGTDMEPGQDFDMNFTVKNVGQEDWDGGETDIRYVEGTKFHTGADVYDLGEEVETGESYTFVVDMKAPDTTGTYYSVWQIQGPGGTYCSMRVEIEVVD